MREITKKEFYNRIKQSEFETFTFVRYNNGEYHDYKTYFRGELKSKKKKVFDSLKTVNNFDCLTLGLFSVKAV